MTSRPKEATRAEWAFDLLCLALYLDGSIGSYAGVAASGFVGLPEAAELAGRSWTPETVRSAVARARRTLDHRLSRARRPGRRYDLSDAPEESRP